MDNELVTNYLEARARRDEAQANLDNHTARLIKQMEADQRKSFRWDDDGLRRTVTYKQSHATEINERGLRRALTARVFDKYTKRVLDRKAMETAIDAGEIDPLVVSRFVQLRPNKPHLTYKVGEPREETE